MKKIVLICLAAILCLFTGCGEPEQPASSAETGAGSVMTSAEAPSTRSAAESEPHSVSTEEPDPEDWDGRVTLLDDPLMKVELLYGNTPENPYPWIYLFVENRSDLDLILDLDGPILNGSIQAEDYFCIYKPGTLVTSMDWGTALLLSEDERLWQADGTIDLYDGAYYYSEDPAPILLHTDYSVRLPQSGPQAHLTVPVLNASFGPQLLLNSEDLQIQLVYFGIDPAHDTQICGLLRAENKSDSTRPLQLNGISFNGRLISDRWLVNQELSPHSVCFAHFHCYTDKLEEQHINTVRSAELLILTDSSENTGTQAFSNGGSWYPLEFLSDGTEVGEDPDQEGILLLEQEDFTVRLTGTEEQWWEYTDGGYYTWTLYVVNRTKQNIDLELEDAAVDGRPAAELKNRPFISGSGVPAGGSRYMEVFYHADTEEARPEINGRLVFYTLGKGALLYTSDRIDLPNPTETD